MSNHMEESAGSTDPADSKRDRLLQAVIEIAGSEGERSVTYRSVAARAGVAHGLVRHYFGSREALLDEAFRIAAQKDISESKIAAENIDDFASGLVDMLDHDSARQLMQFDLVLAAIRNPHEGDTAHTLYTRFYEHTASTVAGAGIDDPDGQWAALLFAIIDGISLQHFLFRDDARTEGMLAKVRTLLAIVAHDVGDRDPAGPSLSS